MEERCIEAQGYLRPDGYIAVGTTPRPEHRTLLAHRVAYEEAHGSIDEGLHVHHRCGNKACVNVEHLEALSASDHQRRHRRECGHNSPVVWGGRTVCRVCTRERKRAWRRRHG